MPLKIIILFTLLLSSFFSIGQDLENSRRTSYLTFIYELTEKEVSKIYKEKSWVGDTTFFHTLVDTYPTDSTYKKQLPNGHYLKVYIRENHLITDVFSVQDFYTEIFNNSTDLQIRVFDKSGTALPGARVKIGSKRVSFDAKTAAYILKKTNKRGVLTVSYEGHTAFYKLGRSFNHSRAKRISAGIVYKTPLKYVWIPVKFLIHVPIDGVRSITSGYVRGSIYQTRNFFVRLYHNVACIFDEYYCEGYRGDYRFENKHRGYLVFSQPKYLPGDTVRMKAYITKKGKPINQPINVVLEKDYRNDIHLTTLQPTQRGIYVYEFIPADTLNLKLDIRYTISLQNKRGRTYMTESFEYEEYELSKNQLSLRVPKTKHFAGDSAFVYASGKDENDLNLLDGRLEVLLTPKNVWDCFQDKLFVPDTLSYFELPLKPEGDTQISISSESFPNANIDYNLSVTLLTSDNERIVEKKVLNYYFEHDEIKFDLVGDSIRFELQRNGKSIREKATLSWRDSFGNTADSMDVELPHVTWINPLYSRYEIKTSTTREHYIVDQGISPLNIFTHRTKDSLFIRTENPRTIPFNYFLYQNNREILRGQNTFLNLQKSSNPNRGYYLSIQYMWGGQVKEENYDIPWKKDLLNIELDAPPIIYPGQQLRMEIRVTDAEGRPAANTDLLAHGLTKKFEYSPPKLIKLLKPNKERKLINTFDIREPIMLREWPSYNYETWESTASLDSIAYFQFLYPQNGLYRYQYQPSDSITQFAIYISSNGELQEPLVIYVDNEPVYLAWSLNEPFSFRVDSGYHSVQVRTDSHFFDFDSLFFPYGKKTTYSFDQDNLPPSASKSERKYELSQMERNRLYRYILPFRDTFKGSFGYFRQGDRYFPLESRNRRELLIGPVKGDTVNFKLLDKFDQSFIHEPYFEYEIGSGLIKMRTIDLNGRIFSFKNRSIENDIGDLVLTQERIMEMWDSQIKKRRTSSRKYFNPSSTKSGYGKLRVQFPDKESAGVVPVNILLFKLDNPFFLRVYPGRSRQQFEDLEQGLYRAIVLFDNGQYALADSMRVEVNGLNYINASSLHVLQEDSFSIRSNILMDKSFMNPKYNPIGKDQLEQLYRNYRGKFQYTGPGKRVSGYVFDEQDEPVAGVNVIVKGTTIGTITDIDGFYSLRIPDSESKLVFSFIGLASQEIELGNRSHLDVSMKEGVQHLSEVVVSAQGVQRTSRALGYAITSVSPNSDGFIGSLQSKVAGINVTRTSGAVGSSPSITIRGYSSVSGNNSPLIIVDGQVYLGDLESLNIDVDQLNQVQAIKPENAMAIYGERAANGVVIVNTGEKSQSGALPHQIPGFNDSFMGLASDASSIRNNFSDLAFWEPVLTTDDEGKVSFEVTFPDDITKWKTFIYAVRNGKQVGQMRDEIKSFKPLAGQLNLPKFLLSGDSTFIVGKALNYSFDSVKVNTFFEINSEIQQQRSIQFKDAFIDSLLVTTRAADTIKAKYYIERKDGYFDGEERLMPIYRKGVENHIGHSIVLNSDTTLDWRFSKENGPVKVTAYANSAGLIKERLTYLLNYRYGCNEQLASKLKAMIVAKHLLANEGWNITEVSDKRIQRMIQKLIDNQNAEGLWGWWHVSTTNLWVSVHVAEALKMAMDKGYSVRLDKSVLVDEAVWHLTSQKPYSAKLDWLYIASLFDLKINRIAFAKELETKAPRAINRRLRSFQIRFLNGLPMDTQELVDSLHTDSYGSQYLQILSKDLSYTDRSVWATTVALNILSQDTIRSEIVKNNVRNYLHSQLVSTARLNTYMLSNIISTLGLARKSSEVLPILSLSGGFEDSVTTFPYIKEFKELSQLNMTFKGNTPLYLSAYQTTWNEQPVQDSTHFKIETRLEKGGLDLSIGKPESIIVDVEVLKKADYVMIEVPIPAGCSYASKKNNYRIEAHREYFKEKTSIFCKQLPEGSYQFKIEVLPRYLGTYGLNPAKIELMYFPMHYAHDGMKRVRIE